MFAIAFPQFDPVAVQLGPLAIRWYALAYIAGLMLGWQYLRWLVRRPGWQLKPEQLDDLLFYVTLGVIFGGRLGYVVFYNPGYFLQNPLEVAYLWQGGMAFHGGMLGVIVALLWFARQHRLSPFEVGDAVCCAVPIGLFFGRIANFINGELYGRASEMPWAVVFPGAGPEPRHPSQLYEALLEGLVLFFLVNACVRGGYDPTTRGRAAGVFLAGYGIARSFVELFRQPDAHLGFFIGGITMGQILSLPMIAVGLGLIVWAGRRRRLAAASS